MEGQFARCAKCGGSNAEAVKFTWWGGVLGPKLLSHVKCQNCGNKYNGKSGKQNTTGIAIYSIVVGGISLLLVLVVFAAFAFR